MANCLFPAHEVTRMVRSWLPEGTPVFGFEVISGDVNVQWNHGPFVCISQADRALSANELTAKYKPKVDASVIETWELVDM